MSADPKEQARRAAWEERGLPPLDSEDDCLCRHGGACWRHAGQGALQAPQPARRPTPAPRTQPGANAAQRGAPAPSAPPAGATQPSLPMAAPTWPGWCPAQRAGYQCGKAPGHTGPHGAGTKTWSDAAQPAPCAAEVVVLRGRYGPVYSVRVGGEWLLDAAGRRRKWAVRQAAEQAAHAAGGGW